MPLRLSLTALAVWLPLVAAAAPDLGAQVAVVAQRYRDERPKLRIEACNGLIEDVLRDAGVDMRGDVRTLYADMRDRGWVHRRRTPDVGDIVFFDDTYDKDRNGRQDDPLSHIAVVIAVDEDGTVQMVHRGSKGIRPLTLNLYAPSERRSPEGKVWNSWLGQTGYARDGHRLAGELWRAFASPRAEGVVVSHNASASRRAPPARPVAPAADSVLPVPADDEALVRVLRGRRVRAKHLEGRSCRELWFLRNAIVARHSFAFTDPQARVLFAALPGYRPDPGVDRAAAASRLTRRDRKNFDTIVGYEGRCR